MEKRQFKYREERFPVPWGHIAAKVYESTSKQHVLMVHGILDNAGSFNRILQFLPKDYQYVAIDLPGHGLSSPYPPGVPLHYFDYVHSIEMVLDALKWDSCIYIGHSFGGYLGIHFATLYPQRIQKIISFDSLISTVHVDDNIDSFISKLYSLKDYTAESKRAYTKEEIMYALQYRRNSTLNSQAAEALFERAVTKVGDLYRYNRDTRLRQSVVPILSREQHLTLFFKCSVPLLVISASESYHSESIREFANIIRSRLKSNNNFQVVTVPGNHDVHNNDPEVVAPYVCKYLQNNLASKL